LQTAVSSLQAMESETSATLGAEPSKARSDAVADEMLAQCKLGEIQQRLARKLGRETADANSQPEVAPADDDIEHF
jgi:hypothetical protein